MAPEEPDRDPDTLTVDVRNMVRTLSRRFHENPLAGLREAVQNAIDAVRDVDEPRIDILLEEDRIEIRDDGVGMSREEARERWTRVFDSAKAGDASAIGEFGIGRFALLGLGDPLELDTRDGDEATRVLIHADGRLEWGEGERTERGTTVAVTGSFRSLLFDALPYVRRVAEKRAEPIYVNGKRVSGRPYAALSEFLVHTFDTDLIRGALGVHDSGEERGVHLFHKDLYVCDLHPEAGITGEVNCDALDLTATRDAVQENAAYARFQEALDEEIGVLWDKVAHSQYAGKFERPLFRRARSSGERDLIANIPVELSDGRRLPWRDVVELARDEGLAITYFSGRRNPVVDEAVERGLAVAVRVHSGDARLALHDDATEHGVESIFRDDVLRRRLEEQEDAEHVEGAGFEPLASALRALLSDEVPNLQVLFMRSDTRRASLAGNVLELNVQDPLLAELNDVAGGEFLLAQALLVPLAAHEVARRDLDRGHHDVHDEFFHRRFGEVRDRLLRRVMERARKG